MTNLPWTLGIAGLLTGYALGYATRAYISYRRRRWYI